MKKNEYSVIGLMSGTSLDGLDLAHVQFSHSEGKWDFELCHSKSLDYDEQMRDKLKNSVNLSALELLAFDVSFGEWLGARVDEFILQNNIEVDFVASHGHTVFHQIDKKLTYQIGSGQELANACSQKVVCDFRSLDVSLGGQGAPLVPIGDQLLFGAYDYCLNLGGIANVSFAYAGKRVAFDITVANMLLNNLTEQIGLAYDKGGKIAQSGSLNNALFDELNALDYCNLPFPKSTGYEWFVEQVLPIVERSNVSMEDKLCTAVHHTCFQVNHQLEVDKASSKKMLATGGGAKNAFLVETLKHYLDDRIELVVPDTDLIDFKESIVFALMGVLRERNEVNCLSSVTGASEDNCGGVIFYPKGMG